MQSSKPASVEVAEHEEHAHEHEHEHHHHHHHHHGDSCGCGHDHTHDGEDHEHDIDDLYGINAELDQVINYIKSNPDLSEDEATGLLVGALEKMLNGGDFEEFDSFAPDYGLFNPANQSHCGFGCDHHHHEHDHEHDHLDELDYFYSPEAEAYYREQYLKELREQGYVVEGDMREHEHCGCGHDHGPHHHGHHHHHHLHHHHHGESCGCNHHHHEHDHHHHHGEGCGCGHDHDHHGHHHKH